MATSTRTTTSMRTMVVTRMAAVCAMFLLGSLASSSSWMGGVNAAVSRPARRRLAGRPYQPIAFRKLFKSKGKGGVYYDDDEYDSITSPEMSITETPNCTTSPAGETNVTGRLPIPTPSPAPPTIIPPTTDNSSGAVSPTASPVVATKPTDDPVVATKPTASPVVATNPTASPVAGIVPPLLPPPELVPTVAPVQSDGATDPSVSPVTGGGSTVTTGAPTVSSGTITPIPPPILIPPPGIGGPNITTGAPTSVDSGSAPATPPTTSDLSPTADGAIVATDAPAIGGSGTSPTTAPAPSDTSPTAGGSSGLGTTAPATAPAPSDTSPTAGGSSGEPDGDSSVSVAPSQVPGSSTVTVPPSTSEGTTPSLTAEFCSNTSPDKDLAVRWVYGVEFETNLTDADQASAVLIMEMQLVSDLLDCELARRGRHVRGRQLLAEGIAGLDYKPDDVKIGEIDCPAGNVSTGICTSYNGIMMLFLEQFANGEAASKDLLFNIRDTMQKSDFPQVSGIVDVWYLEPALSGVSEIEQGGGGDGSDNTISSSSFSQGAVVAFATLGVFVFGALGLAVYRLRGNQPVDGDGALTIEAGSATTGHDTHGSNPPISPFSAMLPNAYKLHDPDTMSAILEGDSDSESKAQSSVIVSDGGYTSDGDSHQESLYTPHINPVLGAQKVDDDNVENDRAFLFENDEDEIGSIQMAPTTGTSDITVKRATPTKQL